jgi:hypothetical protein
MGETVKQLPHIAWAYAAHAWTILVRLWVLPFAGIGWVVGVILSWFSLGYMAGSDCPLGKWAASLRRTHEPKPIKSARVNADDDFDSFDDED